MRERIAIGLSLAAILLVVTLSVLFAAVQNPHTVVVEGGASAGGETAPGPSVEDPEPDEAHTDAQAPDSLRGRAVFQTATCERCHSVEGVGSRRYPLDGVGARRTQAALRAWTLAEGEVLDSLSPSAARAKRPYAELPPGDLDALIAYLAKLVHDP